MPAVRIPMPMLKQRFSAEYSRVEKPSGVEYILLSVISSPGYAESTWGDVMEDMGLDRRLFEGVFAPALRDMRGKMAECMRSDDPTPDDRVYDWGLTPVGKQAFDRGVIAAEPIHVDGEVAYRPGCPAGSEYSEAAGIVAEPAPWDGRFDGAMPDPDAAESYVQRHRIGFGIDDRDAGIFDFRFEGEPAKTGYFQRLDLLFDGATREFALSGGCDSAFVKRTFTGDEIVALVDGAALRLPDGLRFDGRPEDPEGWSGSAAVLPSEVGIGGSARVLLNRERCLDAGGSGGTECDALESDILAVRAPGDGTEYAVVGAVLSVRGMDGSCEGVLALKRPAKRETISKAFASVADGIDVSGFDGFAEAAECLPFIGDAGFAERLAVRHLSGSGDAVESLSRMKTMKLGVDLARAAETFLADSGMDLGRQVEVLKASGVEIGGTVLAAALGGGREERLRGADLLLAVSKDKADVLRIAGLDGCMPEIVLSGADMDPESGEFAKALSAHGKLLALKKDLGIASIDDSRFDLDAANQLEASLQGRAAAISAEVDALRGLAGAGAWKEVDRYLDFFMDVAQAVRKETRLDRAKGRQLGILLGVKIEDALKSCGLSGDLAVIIREAHKKGLVNDGECRELDAIREFRNRCAHQVSVADPPDGATRKRWIALVESLSQPEPADGERGRGR